MKTFEINGYEIEQADMNGGWSSTFLYYVSTLELAQKICASGNGILSLREVKKTIVVYDSLEEIEHDNRKSIKEAALAKLSDAEKRVLGLV